MQGTIEQARCGVWRPGASGVGVRVVSTEVDSALVSGGARFLHADRTHFARQCSNPGQL
jgi:hypothetical protein